MNATTLFARPVRHRTGAALAAAITTALAAGPRPLAAAPPAVSGFELDNGIRVVVLHVEGSPRAALISVLPLGLASDGAGRTQWSHLLEHLTLRTTGPITDYRERNAETMSEGMHLDWIGPAETWTEGLDLHATWLSNRPFTAASLDEERPKAIGELDATVANLFTHKWAIAAWNQVVRHGAGRVEVAGALAGAALDELQAYRDRHLVVLERTVVCLVGGVSVERARPEIERRLGTLGAAAGGLPAATVERAAPADLEATWDLDAGHYVESYRIPGPGHADYPALVAAAAHLGSRLGMDPNLQPHAGHVICDAMTLTPEGNWLTLSASLRPGADLAEVRTIFRRHVGAVGTGQSAVALPMMARHFARLFEAPADPAAAQGPGADAAMIEANAGLQWALSEFRFGEHRKALVEGLRKLSAEGVAAATAQYLDETQRVSVVLRRKS